MPFDAAMASVPPVETTSGRARACSVTPQIPHTELKSPSPARALASGLDGRSVVGLGIGPDASKCVVGGSGGPGIAADTSVSNGPGIASPASPRLGGTPPPSAMACTRKGAPACTRKGAPGVYPPGSAAERVAPRTWHHFDVQVHLNLVALAWRSARRMHSQQTSAPALVQQVPKR